METSKLIANRIIDICNERNITVGKLCTMAGATGSTVSDIMNGATKNPGVLTIKKLCDAAGISLSEFFDTPEFDLLDQEVK